MAKSKETDWDKKYRIETDARILKEYSELTANKSRHKDAVSKIKSDVKELQKVVGKAGTNKKK